MACADNAAQSKSAVCHAQVKADPVKLFTCTFKTRQLSTAVTNVCAAVVTRPQAARMKRSHKILEDATGKQAPDTTLTF